ncbi:MAG: hypothetical protein ACFHWZ_02500 [Phycisphaerales bacterium]
MAKRANSSKAGASGLPLGPDSRIVLLTGKEHFLRSGYTDQLREMLNESEGERSRSSVSTAIPPLPRKCWTSVAPSGLW